MQEKREKLLLARSEELRCEYDNLIKSLNAAYETIKTINGALAENRAESRKIFQERLTLASPKNTALEIPVRSITQRNTCAYSHSDVNNCVTNLYSEDDGKSVIITKQHAFNNLIYDAVTQQKQTIDTKIDLLAQLNTAPTATNNVTRKNSSNDAIASNDEQQVHTPKLILYMGDEHSYAVNDDSDKNDEIGETGSSHAHGSDIARASNSSSAVGCVQEASISAAIAVKRDDGDSKIRANFRPDENDESRATTDETSELDLSIVKTEWPDESYDQFYSLHELDANNVELPIKKSLMNHVAVSQRASVSRKRYRTLKDLSNDEIIKRREKTRDRMRRWRAKKRLQQLTNQSTKCKVVLGKLQMFK